MQARTKWVGLSADLRSVMILAESSEYLQHVRKRRAGQALSPLTGLKVSRGPAATDRESASQHHKEVAAMVHCAVVTAKSTSGSTVRALPVHHSHRDTRRDITPQT